MATTLDPATLTIQVREEITLNNRKLGGQNVHKISVIQNKGLINIKKLMINNVYS